MPMRSANSGDRSTSTSAKRTWERRATAAPLKCGLAARLGEHHGAQKFTSVGRSLRAIYEPKVVSSSSATGFAASTAPHQSHRDFPSAELDETTFGSYIA